MLRKGLFDYAWGGLELMSKLFHMMKNCKSMVRASQVLQIVSNVIASYNAIFRNNFATCIYSMCYK